MKTICGLILIAVYCKRINGVFTNSVELSIIDNDSSIFYIKSKLQRLELDIKQSARNTCRYRSNYKKQCEKIVSNAVTELIQLKSEASASRSIKAWRQMRSKRSLTQLDKTRPSDHKIDGGDDTQFREKLDHYHRGSVEFEFNFDGIGVDTISLPMPQCEIEQAELIQNAVYHCLSVLNKPIGFIGPNGGCVNTLIFNVKTLWKDKLRQFRSKAQLRDEEVPLITFFVNDNDQSLMNDENNENDSTWFKTSLSHHCRWNMNLDVMVKAVGDATSMLVNRHAEAFGVNQAELFVQDGNIDKNHWFYETVYNAIVKSIPHNTVNNTLPSSTFYNIKPEAYQGRQKNELASMSHMACDLSLGCIQFTSLNKPASPDVTMRLLKQPLNDQIDQEEQNGGYNEEIELNQFKDVAQVLSLPSTSKSRGSTVDSQVFKGIVNNKGQQNEVGLSTYFVAKFTAPGFRGLSQNIDWLTSPTPFVADHEFNMLSKLNSHVMKQASSVKKPLCKNCYPRPYYFWGDVSPSLLSLHSSQDHQPEVSLGTERSKESWVIEPDPSSPWRGYVMEDVGAGQGVSSLAQVARCGWRADLTDAYATVLRLLDILQLLQDAGISHNDYLPHNLVTPKRLDPNLGLEEGGWSCTDNAFDGTQWRVIDFGYSSMIGEEKSGGFPYYLGISNGIDCRPPQYEIEGRDDIYSLGKSFSQLLPLKSLLLTGVVAEMTMFWRGERAHQVAQLSLKARRIAAIGGDLFPLKDNKSNDVDDKSAQKELHLCVLWEPGLVASLYDQFLHLPAFVERQNVSLRAVHFHPAFQSATERVKTITAFYASSLFDGGMEFGSQSFRVDDRRGRSEFVVLFIDAFRPLGSSATWDELVDFKSNLRQEINALNIEGVNGYNSLHCTEKVEESVENLVALGYSHHSVPDGDVAVQLPEERPRFSDVEGVFTALENGGVGFVILRNWERDLATFDSVHEDVDLLVDDLLRAKKLIGALPGLYPYNMADAHVSKHGRVCYIVAVNGREMKFDLRFVGDEYYPEAWANQMIQTRVPIPGIVNGWRPNPSEFFFALLYHASIHKPSFDQGKYDHLCQMIAPLKFLQPTSSSIKMMNKNYDVITDEEFCDNIIGTAEKRFKILKCFMVQHGYEIKEFYDQSKSLTEFGHEMANALRNIENKIRGTNKIEYCFAEFGIQMTSSDIAHL